jgi:sn-glycerol 3-phosphate transport system ATP-binding protein
VREPTVFLFDEPLSNLDAKLRVQMRAELQTLHQRLQTTTLYVTHDQVEAMTLADRMLVMSMGRAEQIGAPAEVYSRPTTTFVAGFIGSPPMNLIRGRVEEGGAALVLECGVRARLPRPISEFAGRDMLLGVRPEHLEVCDEASAMLTPDIDFIELLGSDLLVYGQLDAAKPDSRIAARLDVSSGAKKGPLSLRFDGANMHLFDPQTGKRLAMD